ncbi:MAG TPA: LacI family DNA-binding transcriptional regulator [Feifaniaceae bacterium]|nr:LacI family DNA-binding transcriptional regulator [Feifaniaceae bacterium]
MIQRGAGHTASIKDVAERAGVGISTVSHVLNSTKQVSPELRRRVLDAAEELNYRANAIARGLKSGRTNVLCVIVPSIVSVFFPKVLRGMQTAAAEQGYSLSIYETGEDLNRERAYIQLLKNQWVDGILLSTCCDPARDRGYVDELRGLSIGGKRVPVVFFEALPGEGLDGAIVDNRQAACGATAHLIKSGRKRIAHIAAPTRFTMGAERCKGYRDGLEQAGIPLDPALVCEGDYTPMSGYARMRELLECGKTFDAALCGNDQMAIGALRALNEAGVSVPGEIAVMGFDNNFPGTLVSPSLSTVSVPKQRMGREAVGLLLWRMRHEDAPPRAITLETSLIIRRSTDPDGESGWDLYDW